MTHVNHGFGPWFDKDSQVLILGTMPSPKSREANFYYAHPQNRFWRVLPALFDEPALTGNIEAQKEFLTRHHIALWDVLESCDISGASDASIRNPTPNNISYILDQAPIKKVFATGKKAASLYEKLCYPECGMHAVALPSTSPANCAVTFEKLIKAYSQIYLILNEERNEI